MCILANVNLMFVHWYLYIWLWAGAKLTASIIPASTFWYWLCIVDLGGTSLNDFDTHLPYLPFVKHNDRYQGRLSQLSQATFFSQLRLEKNFCKMLRHVASYHENPWNLLVFIKRLGLITKIIQNPRICGCLKVGNRIPDGLCLWSNGNGEQILHFETKPGESLFARNQPLLGGSSDQRRQWLNL